MSQEITVIGAGIIGASIAWHLTAAGAKVRLVAEAPGGVATPNSFAWINASWGNPPEYFKLRTRSMLEWKRLAEDVPGLSLTWQGGLCWDLPHEDLLAYAAQHAAWGYDIRQVQEAEILAIEPALDQPPSLALHVRQEGAVEPFAAAQALVADARRHGMEVLEGIRVTGLGANGGRIDTVLTDAGPLRADHVVVAAGAETAALCASVGIEVPIDAPPGLLVHSKPLPPILNGLVIAPELHVRQTAEGRLVAGSDFGGTDPGTDPEKAAVELFAKLKAFLEGGKNLEMDFFTVGYRPTPRDGFPIVGSAKDVGGLYVAVTHSGITLAPALGLFAAQEILQGLEEPMLSPYRLSRFA